MLYNLVIKPYLFYRKYKSYSNVFSEEKFRPLVGDVSYMIESENKGSVYYSYFMDRACNLTDYDMVVFLLGPIPILRVLSLKAMKELESMIPNKIDRKAESRHLGKVAPNGMPNQPSIQTMNARRSFFLKVLNINSASKYIPDMIHCVNKLISKFEVGKQYEFFEQLNQLTLDIFIRILFGK